MLYHMNNTFPNTIFQISVAVSLTSQVLPTLLFKLITFCFVKTGKAIQQKVLQMMQLCSNYIDQKACRPIDQNLQACNFTKKRLKHRHFPVHIAKFLRIAIYLELQNYLQTAASQQVALELLRELWKTLMMILIIEILR